MSIFLTVRETADLLKLNHQYVQYLCRTKKLPAAKIGREWRVRRADLLEQMGVREGGG